jgi:nitrite reductase/ring-hydroxylating ferredoxin subunit
MPRILVGPSDRFPEGKAIEVDADGTSVLVARVEGRLCAIRNRCAHLPVPLQRGKVEGRTIVCPFHNSRFDLCSGENLDWVPGILGVKVPAWSSRLLALGKKPRGVAAYEVEEEDGQVFVRT